MEFKWAWLLLTDVYLQFTVKPWSRSGQIWIWYEVTVMWNGMKYSNIYGPPPWCTAYGLQLGWWGSWSHDDGRSRLSWRCQRSVHACVQGVLWTPYIRSHDCSCSLEYTRLLAISISTGYEPGYHYYLNSHDLSYNLFHNFQKSLKNPKLHHRSNSRIHSTKTQHHRKPPSHDDFLKTLPSHPLWRLS